MLNYTYTQARRELSKNVVMEGSKLISAGTDEQRQQRNEFRNQFNVTVLIEGVPSIGIKFEVEFLEETLAPIVYTSLLWKQSDDSYISHTDASKVSSAVLTAYATIRDRGQEWSRDKDKPFSDILKGYEYEVYK